MGDPRSETSRDGSKAKEEVHMSRKRLIIPLNPHSPQKSLKKVYIYIRAFFFLAVWLGVRGTEEAEMREGPSSYQPSVWEMQRPEI